MKKDEFIARYGEEKYLKMQEQARQWHSVNPDKVEQHSHDRCRKGGKGYLQAVKYAATGLQAERNKIRGNHRHTWSQYKKIIAPKSQIHHEWVPETADFRGVALVEADRHMHGFIDVIQILEGKITVFAEKELEEQEHGNR